MIVYVTGCLGFIGSYVTEACLKRGWHVFGIDKCTYASNIEQLDHFKTFPNFKFEQKDITEIDRLVDCDYFINTAAETHVDNSIRKSDDFIHSNIMGVYNILELFRNYTKTGYSQPTLLHFSTDEVYGDISSGDHSEVDILRPSNPYSATKAAGDQLIMAWSRTYNIPYVIVRPTNNYGIGQYVEKLIPKACKFISMGRKIPLHMRGTPVRIWLHAKDTAEAVVSIIQAGSKNEIFNVSGGFEQSNYETVKKIIDVYTNNSVKDYDEFINFEVHRPGQDIRYSLDDSKLRSLGWSPKCVFDNEIPQIVKYYTDNFIW